FWPPDGRSVGFFADDKLKRIDLAGGSPTTVTAAPNRRGGPRNAAGGTLLGSGATGPARRGGGSPRGTGAAARRSEPPRPRATRPAPAGVSSRRQTVRVHVGARHGRHQRRLSRLAGQDAVGAPAGGRSRRPIRRARQAADDPAGRAAGVHVQRRRRRERAGSR